ncbi:efflux RND transporter periplasmic adaptor subunit [Candidatus Binatia bacterium]|nr:efflux RND transporter periplasmic adaptor subunit [Candidatus Binatia bacterium]
MTSPRPVGKLIVFGGLVAVAATTAIIGWRSRPAPPAPVAAVHEAADTVRLDAAQRTAAGIVVEPARAEQRTEQLEAPGTLAVDGALTARIGAIVEAKVLAVFVQVGDRVHPGQVLAELHSHIIHESWAAYRKALAERKRATAELTYAVEADERARRLFADKAVSLQEVQRTQVDRDLAVQALDMANTEVRRSAEVMEHLGITSGDDPRGEGGEQIPVRSPIGGAVLERLVTEGTAVTAGAPLFVVSDLLRLWALAEVNETALPLLRVGSPVTLRVAAYPAETFSGTIVFVGDTLDPITRRVTVRCSVPNPDGRLKPNMFATITFETRAPRQVVTVPTDAVQDLDGTQVVFVTTDGETFTSRPIATGTEAGGRVEVAAGLAAGERLAVAGSFLLKSELLKSAAAEE